LDNSPKKNSNNIHLNAKLNLPVS